MQKVPDINLVAHEGDIICDDCGQEVEFLIGPDPINDGKNRCKRCFTGMKPEYAEALTDFSDLLNLMLEMQSRMMSLDMMHELYGNSEEAEED
jgi:hypothetical protein